MTWRAAFLFRVGGVLPFSDDGYSEFFLVALVSSCDSEPSLYCLVICCGLGIGDPLCFSLIGSFWLVMV